MFLKLTIRYAQEAARAAAKRLYQKVNFSGGALQSVEVSSLLTNVYDFLKIPFKPSTKDIKGYAQVLDANHDGQVTLEDLEHLAVQYITGPGVLLSHSIDRNYRNKKLEVSGSGVTFTSALNANSYTLSSKLESGNYKNQKPNTQLSQNIPEKQYNQRTLSYLAASKQIFKTHADSQFTITLPAVAQLLAQTYEILGRKGYRPSEEDVRVWMRLCDGNGDGRVEYAEYEYFVARSLQRSGLQIYQ